MIDDIFTSPSKATTSTATAMLSPPPEEELRQLELSAAKPKRNTFIPSKSPVIPFTQPLANSSRVNLNMQDTDTANKVKRKRSSPVKSSFVAASDGNQEYASGSHVTATPNPRARKQTKLTTATPTRSRSPVDDLFSGTQSKPKRATAAQGQAADATPTRKRPIMRKSIVPTSPHALNPNANYIPPSMLSVGTAEGIKGASTSYRRRGSTPIPPYEPPAERFTPPREIQLTAPPTSGSPGKSKRRTTHAKPNSKEKGSARASTPQLPVKLELPEIDLTVPPPPPSPSDDPILLIGVSRAVASTPKKRGSSDASAATQTPTRRGSSFGPTTAQTPSSLFDDIDEDMDMEIPQPDFAPSSSFFSDDIPPVFDFENMAPNDAGWSDSDDEQPKPGEPGVVEGEGEFTGRFYQYRSPLKVHDPPSSATRVKMDQWGRPISPHPRLLIADGSISPDAIQEDEEPENGADDSPSASKSRGVSPANEFEEERSGWVDEGVDSVAGPSGSNVPMTLSEIEEAKFGDKSIMHDDEERNEPSIEVEIPKVDVVEEVHREQNSSGTKDDDLSDVLPTTMEMDDVSQIKYTRQEDAVEERPHHFDAVAEPRDPSPELNPPAKTQRSKSPSQEVSGRLSPFASAKSLRASSRPLDNRDRSQSVNPFAEESPPRREDVELHLQVPVDVDEEVGSGDGSDSDPAEDLVSIKSSNPQAAARVAAILKMHDYDTVEREKRRRRAAEDKLRKFRRRSALESGVSKSYTSPRNGRKSLGIHVQSSLADVSVPDLIKAAEIELRNTPTRSRASTPQLRVRTPAHSESPAGSTTNLLPPGPREWVKADWKRLDSCFTDERYQIAVTKGMPIGSLADVDVVDDGDVVERFADEMGGYAILEELGPAWTLEKLTIRVRSLRKRQRLGQGAPPTPGLSSRYTTASPSGSMIVPDFTPSLDRISRASFFGRPSLPPPQTPTMFAKSLPPVPPFSLGPGYTQLRDVVPAAPTTHTADANIWEEESQDISPTASHSPLEEGTSIPTSQQQPPASAVKRSLSYLTSWLRASSQKPRLVRKEVQRLPGLPAPPADVAGKPRGPVNTPSKREAEKLPHPKELVDLQHAPLPPEHSRIPRKKVEPKRLVDLNHAPTPQPKEIPRSSSLLRRSSSSSVKDLIRSFESLDDDSQRSIALLANKNLQRVRSMESVGGGREKQNAADAGSSKLPRWKPCA